MKGLERTNAPFLKHAPFRKPLRHAYSNQLEFARVMHCAWERQGGRKKERNSTLRVIGYRGCYHGFGLFPPTSNKWRSKQLSLMLTRDTDLVSSSSSRENMSSTMNLSQASVRQVQDFLSSFDVVFSDCDGEFPTSFYLFSAIFQRHSSPVYFASVCSCALNLVYLLCHQVSFGI